MAMPLAKSGHSICIAVKSRSFVRKIRNSYRREDKTCRIQYQLCSHTLSLIQIVKKLTAIYEIYILQIQFSNH